MGHYSTTDGSTSFLSLNNINNNNNNCRVTNCSPHLDGNRKWAQQARYNKFVREWVEELGQQIFATVIGGRVLGRGG